MADILVLINDLIFETRIRAAAADAGLTTAVIKDAASLATAISSGEPKLVIIDLDCGPASVQAASEAAGHLAQPRTLCFVSHVNRELAAAARDAGAEVLPRSAFVQRLPEILARVRAAGSC